MARPVEFDVSKALNKALVLFWRKGYQATSLADLLEAMAIGRSSFYAAFGDKRALFLTCLDLFGARTKDIVRRTRSDMPPLDVLHHFFERQFIGPSASKAQWGCMLVNTVLELADVDTGLSARASDHLAEIQALFEERLLEAGFPAGYAVEMASFLMLVNEGVRVSNRRKLTIQQQLAPIETTFRLLRRAVA
jgi:TetR/AcrR family transcriptional regulator, transcriptional repressor for nem operon